MGREGRIAAWTRPSVRDLPPYYRAPLAGGPLRLDQNTNLWGPNPLLARLDWARLDVSQYPSRDADDLRAALARHHGVPADRFVVGNGGDELLDIVTKTFTVPGQVLATPWPGYSLYPFYAKVQDLRLVRVPLRGGLRVDADALLAARGQVTIVASPNNPTGRRVAGGELERLAEGLDGILVVDEAYIEYAGIQHSLLPRVDDFDNLVVMRTFSKAHGLAGLRIGYMAANPDLAARLCVVKPPFNLNTHSEAAAVAAIADTTWMEGVVQVTLAERERMAAGLARLGLRVHESEANFLLCDSPVDPALVVDGLRRRAVLARRFPGSDGLEHAVRFTVGRPEHTDRLLAALAEVLA